MQEKETLNTPLHFAVRINNNDSVHILLRHGANCTIKNIHNKTPQEYANAQILAIFNEFSMSKSDQ